MYLLLMGMPGAGKGTQAALMQEKLGLPHITSGGIFRALKTQDTPLACQVRDIMASGGLVPDDITIEIVRQRLRESDARNGFILDGFPRTLTQAESLDGVMAEMSKELTAVLFLKTDDEEVVQRISGRWICTHDESHIFHTISFPPHREGICDECGAPLYQRDDDKPDSVRKRLEQYHLQTEPLLAYYQRKGLVQTIDAGRPIDVVAEDIARLVAWLKATA